MLEQRFNKPKPAPYTQRSRNSRPLALACSLHVSAGLVWRNLEEPSGEDFNVTLSKQVTRPLSILDPLTCGYAKVILYEASKEKFSSEKIQERDLQGTRQEYWLKLAKIIITFSSLTLIPLRWSFINLQSASSN